MTVIRNVSLALQICYSCCVNHIHVDSSLVDMCEGTDFLINLLVYCFPALALLVCSEVGISKRHHVST